ncbi:HD domain-containing phosphohydrolase [Paenibacillus sp. MBLB4367]|uniref:bifunctional diguanylate cyclase/phosphohydrolase n=1 Tax=Paenibacillus sp. MBLB4367 TaxID=3384767 RepID=UPI0039083E79
MNGQKDHQAVYRHELGVLERSRLELGRPDVTSDSLKAEYVTLLNEYEKLMKWSKKIAAISDTQAKILRRRETDIKSLLDHTNQGFLTFGPSLRVNPQFSKECERIFGKSVSGADVVELLFAAEAADRDGFCNLLRHAFRASVSLEEAVVLLSKLPERVVIGNNSVVLEYRPIVDEITEERLVLLIVTDVSERLASEERINYLSFRDALTALYNRSFIEPVLQVPPAPELFPVSLLVIDLNGLKLANDVFGHREGDRLLIRGAELLRTMFGEDVTLARWGGDEFVAILPHTDKEACEAAVALLKAGCEQSAIDPVKVSMAIGAATLTNADQSLSAAFIDAEKQMYKNKLLESKKVRAEMMQSVTTALIARGVERNGHQQRLSDQALPFAQQIGLLPNSHEMNLLQSLIRMHDVGYLALPHDILLKSGSLSEEEWELVKSHSEIGYRMASSIGEWALAEAILGMHEHWDGGGYPYGISQEQIPFISRLLAIVEAFDVMTHEQVYKQEVSSEEALHEIETQAGRQFDPLLAAAWVDFVRAAEAGGRE